MLNSETAGTQEAGKGFPESQQQWAGGETHGQVGGVEGTSCAKLPGKLPGSGEKEEEETGAGQRRTVSSRTLTESSFSLASILTVSKVDPSSSVTVLAPLKQKLLPALKILIVET